MLRNHVYDWNYSVKSIETFKSGDDKKSNDQDTPACPRIRGILRKVAGETGGYDGWGWIEWFRRYVPAKQNFYSNGCLHWEMNEKERKEGRQRMERKNVFSEIRNDFPFRMS